METLKSHAVTVKKVAMDLPQNVRCSKCRAILYSGLELESPADVMQRYNNVCPKCGKPLEFSIKNIKILQNADKV